MENQKNILFEYYRAVFSVCVVAIHAGYFLPSKIFEPKQYNQHVFTFSDIINFYIFSLAVPAFYAMSCYLYGSKRRNIMYLKKRISRILLLLASWSILFNMFKYPGWKIVYSLPTDLLGGLQFILTGGNSIFYFFVSLLLLTALTHVLQHISMKGIVIGFFSSTLILAALPLISLAVRTSFLVVYWNPLNFVPYPFLSMFILRLLPFRRQAYTVLGVFGLLSIATAFWDWTVLINPLFFETGLSAIPFYSRVSLVFLAGCLLILAGVVQIRSNEIIRCMSAMSLSLYCLHPFWIDFAHGVAKISTMYVFPTTVILSVMLSYGSAIVLSKWIMNPRLLE